jgi:hypothetical protein
MQSNLFGPFEPSQKKDKPRYTRKEARPGNSESNEPDVTLFGVVETKLQASKRAKRIVQLLGLIEGAPETFACYENDIRALAYFIERATAAALTPNDRDGLLRFVGDLEELLSEEELREMQENQTIWRPYPRGWIGMLRGELYAAALHPKEIAYLLPLQDERRGEIAALRMDVEEAEAELAALKRICPLRDDVAARYSLTPVGDRLKPTNSRRSA